MSISIFDFIRSGTVNGVGLGSTAAEVGEAFGRPEGGWPESRRERILWYGSVQVCLDEDDRVRWMLVTYMDEPTRVPAAIGLDLGPFDQATSQADFAAELRAWGIPHRVLDDEEIVADQANVSVLFDHEGLQEIITPAR